MKVKLETCVEILDKKRIPLSVKERCNLEKKYPYYGAQGVIDYVDNYIFDGEYILVAEDGNNLKTLTEPIATWASGKFWVNNHAHILGKKSGYCLKYIYYLLNSMDLRIYITGSAQPKFNQENLSKVLLELPNYDTQCRIANLLSQIDNKSHNNDLTCLELDSLAKTIYDYWFLQFDFPNEDGKPYKSSGGKMVWNEELKREIPEGWNVTNVGNITTCLDSKRVPLSSKDRENMKGPYPYYGATSEMDSVNEYLFDGDYVLLAEDGSVMDDNGFPILQRTSGKVWVNNHAHVLQPKKPYGCKLLMFILKNIPVSMIKTGSIQMKVNQENLNAFKVLSIPENLIEKANSILNPIDAKIIMLKQENQKLASLRDFLLPMLMNGQVTFKD